MDAATLALGVQTTVVGLGVVFTVLVLLWFLTGWMDRMIDAQNASSSAPASGQTPVSAKPAAPAATSGKATLSAATVAAILGAISATSGVPMSDLKFTAIQRSGGQRLVWSEAGVAEIINTRQQFL